MSSEGGGKLRPKRSHSAPPKPYERKKSLLGKVAETVKEIFSPSWLSDLVANINKTPVKEDEKEAENEDKPNDPHETGLLSTDSAGPGTSFRAYDYDPLRIRSNGQPRNQDFPSQAVSSLPSTVISPLNEFTSAQLPLTRLVQKSDSMVVNDDNQSQRSDISKSTSGCSSMIPHPDKRDYQSEILQEEHSYSDVSISASASASTIHHPLQLQHPSDKYQRVPVVEKTYAWTPHSSGIQHSKPQVPANRNQPSFNASLFGSPIQADTSYMEQRFESSFYAGKTTYGGASAYRKARVNNASPYQSYPVRKQIKPKPTNNTFNAVTSSTARRILEALEKMSTPVNDAKRFPVNDYLQGSFLAQNPSSNRSFSGQSSNRALPGPSGFNSSFTSRRSEEKKGPPLNRIMVPEFATISKNRQKATSPEVMAKLDARIREENNACTVEVNSWSISHQDTLAVKDLPTGASSGKMKRDKSYHKPAKKLEQDDMLSIPDLKTDFTLPLKELPKFQFTPTFSGSKAVNSNLQKEKLSPKFTFSSPMKEVQPVEERHSASSVISQEFKFSSPIKVDEKKNSTPGINFVASTSSGTSFSTSWCSFGVAVSKPSVASSTEQGLILKSPLSDTAPRAKEPPKSNASDPKQGNSVEALKGSKSPFQPAAQLKAGSVMDILGKTGSNLGSMSTPAGSWKCDTCLIQNKVEVNKCVACGSSKPVKSTGTGFGFTTTPLVSVAAAGCWKCDTCLIQNKADVNRCAACGSAKPVTSKGSESSGLCPESYLNPFPPGNWICASCLIQNKADAVKCGKCQSDKPAGKSGGITKTENSLFDKFKPAVGSWTCNICLVPNEGCSTKCVSCETQKPPPKTGDTFMNSFKKPLGTWDCEICLVTNKSMAVQCIACDSPRPGEKPKHLVPSVAGFKIAAGAFSQNSGFNLPCVAQNESSAPSLFKFGSTSVKSDTTTTTPVPFGFKFGDSFQSGMSSEKKPTQNTFKLGDSNTGAKTNSTSVVDSQAKKVDSGNSDFKVGGETTTITVETKSASIAVGGTTDNVFGQQQNVASKNDLHKENLTTEELNLKPSDSNTFGNSVKKTGGFEFRFTPSSSNQFNSTSFPSSTSTGDSSFNKPTIDSLDSSVQTLSESQRTSGGITTTSQFSTQSNVSNLVTVNKLDSQQSSAPSSKAESLPTDGSNFKSSTLSQANAASDTNKLAVGGFNFTSKSSEESKVENNKPFVFGATDNAVAKKSIFTLKPSSETSKLKRTNSDEESDAHPGGKRQAMGFGEGSVVNNATGVFTPTIPFQFTPTAVNNTGVNASNTNGNTGMFNFGQQNSGTSAPSFLSSAGTNVSPFNPTGFGSSPPAATAPTAAPVFNFTGQNSAQNSSVFMFTGQSSTTKSSPFPALGSVMNTVSNNPIFGGTSQFSVTDDKDDTSSNMVITPVGSTTTLAFGGFGSSEVTGTTKPASLPFGGASNPGSVFTGMGSSNTQFGGNGFGTSAATAPGFGGSSGTSFGVPAPIFGGNATSPATTTAGFPFTATMFNSTTQNSTFQFNPKPIDSKPQQQSANAPSSVFVFGQSPANSTPQQQSSNAASSVFVFGQTPAETKPQQQSATAPSSVFVFGQTPANSKPQQQSSNAASSVFVFGQTPANSTPQQQSSNAASSVFVFGQTPADSKPQQQSVTAPNSVFVFGQTPANSKPQQQSSNAASSVFVFGQTPTDNKPQQQSVASPNSVFVFGPTSANPKPQQQSGTGSNSVFVFGQSQTNTPTQVAPTSPGPFNFNPTPVFNFTGSSTPGPYSFSATSSQGENPSSNRKIKKAVRKIRR
ncbi:hypothetical protein CHS0354_036691 [Potamilus streckersoni]|uniref:Nuclear pore complex protein Nup153 n=1 Tax=Potamilus streckersoni TaxID=2493646 RepID=A0AAE0TGE4_9BIVA|nr:hypothetical protein CHS0354_036691 [Potamilus streckersoni]